MDPTQLLAPAFLGLNATQPVALGPARRRIYLDAAATCLMPRQVWDTVGRYLEFACANPHSHASAVSRATTQAIADTHALVCQFFGSNPATDSVILTGSGATEPNNLLANALFNGPTAGRPIALVSSMEHHSNLLPWVKYAQQVVYIDALPDGSLDIGHLASLVQQYNYSIRVIAVTALSNATGTINPISVVADLAHSVGAEIAVDAAQAAAHFPINMQQLGIDHLVASGHKMYAPGSPGILICKRPVIDGFVGQVGGGMVDRVELGRVWYKTDPSERQEAGTPNVPGTVALGAAVKFLNSQGGGKGVDSIRAHDVALIGKIMTGLAAIPGVVMYGPSRAENRGGLVSFNVGDIPHGLVAAALNDFFAIAVRNDCFCAQPYVRQQLDAACDVRGFCDAQKIGKRGMVRASLGLWVTSSDIDSFLGAIGWIAGHRDWLFSAYEMRGDDWVNKTWKPDLVFRL